jgi:hypothetical protein
MTQRDWVKIAGGVVIGLAVAALLGAGLFGFNVMGDTETEVTLYAPGDGGPCTLGKAPYVRAKKGKKVIWEIVNHCEGADKVVSVGNFRKASGPSGANDCSDAGADYPFKDAALSTRMATVASGGDGDITLKVKGRGDLGDEAMTVYFDICLDGRKADPELMIER